MAWTNDELSRAGFAAVDPGLVLDFEDAYDALIDRRATEALVRISD